MITIKGKPLSIIGLCACWIYLITCILFDILDNPTIELPYDAGLADPRLYYVPLYGLLDVMLYCAYATFKVFGKYHNVQWFGFIMLSASQTSKNIFFNATVRTVNDYVLLIIVIIYIIYQLFIKKRK